MNNDLYGIFECNGKEYHFVLDGRIVRIIGEPFQYIKDFIDADEIEVIQGVTAGNRNIQFLRCKFPKNCFGFASSFSIQGYAISNNNMGNPCDFTYNRSSFESDAINTFFSPQKAVNIDMDIENWTGEINIKLSPFQNTTREFSYLDSKCQLSISRHVRIDKEPTSIGKVKSLFTFEHSKIQPLIRIIDDFLALYDFLSFANYNSNISFKNINISQKNEEGFFEKTATVHIFVNKTEYENTRWNSITIDDIPEEKLSAIFTCIASLRKNDNRLRYYFPESEHNGKYIDPGKWLITALNFEGLFSTKFPNFKCNINDDFRNAKELALERIDNNSDGKSLSRKEQGYYKKCREQLEHYEGQLEEKFNYVFDANKAVLDGILKYNENNLGVQASVKYGSVYATYRNKIAHGSVEPLTDNEVAVYRIILPLIYILMLSEIDLSDTEKKKMIDKLFR
jgi:hypothetical protein